MPGRTSLCPWWGNSHRFFGDSLVELRDTEIRHTSAASKAVTDSSGLFVLDPQTGFKADSLAIRVSAVDRPTYPSELFALPASRTEILRQTAAEMSGCRGCETVTPAGSYVESYRYEISVTTIVIAF